MGEPRVVFVTIPGRKRQTALHIEDLPDSRVRVWLRGRVQTLPREQVSRMRRHGNAAEVVAIRLNGEYRAYLEAAAALAPGKRGRDGLVRRSVVD